MTAALAYKELRENAWIAAIGLAAMLVVALVPMGHSPIPMLLGQSRYGVIPFLSDTFAMQFGLVAFLFALALGFRQSLGDFAGDAHLFLLHRPATRQRVFGTKLAIGLGLYLLCGALPIVLYAVWAATPGNHASPFEWSMTAGVWVTWLSMTAVYLGALLSGLRPASWWGTRMAPLACAAMIAFLLAMPLPWLVSLAILALGDLLLAACIFWVVNTREFA
jgi:hypothetical protein